MADGLVQVQPDSTGKKIDTTELLVGANTVERQRVQLAGAAAASLAEVANSAPAGSEYALLTRNIPSGTQPVSGTVSATQGTAAASAGAWPVKLTDGTHDADIVPASTAATATSPAIVVALSPNTPLPPGTNAVGSVTGPTLTKGTQGATGFSVQQLKDAGRVIRTFTATNFTAATTEGLVTLTPASDGTTAATGTSFSVTAGKRLRLTGIMVLTKNAGAAVQNVIVRVRMNPAGAVTASSPILASVGCATTAATAGSVAHNSLALFEGIELSGTMQIGISQIGTATAGNDVVLVGYEY